MTASSRTVEIWSAYTFGCPEGKWTGRLDHKAWGKDRVQNLILYFSEVHTDHKYWFSVFWRKGYGSEGKKLEFLRDIRPGAVLELTTTRKRKSNNPRLIAAETLSG